MQLRATIDRFEGRQAVLLVEGLPEPLNLPRKLLPPEAEEGSVLTISLEVSGGATRRARDEAERSTKRLSEDQ